jgi:pimeloyl-ACP methyl ester carboxylesterase
VHEDWGVRADRWAGVRSEWVDVVGTRVHVLRADAAPEAPADAPPQLLVHGLGGSATNWIEVLNRLTVHGPVVALDLPGFGRTEPPRRGATRLALNARFLRAFADAEGLDRVVLHGNSMGGLLAVMFAELAPERVERLILVDPALPAPFVSLRELDRRTLGRFAPFAIPAVGRAVLASAWRRLDAEALWADNVSFVHGDGSRLSPEIEALGIENLDRGREQPWRLEGFTTAATSVVAAVTVGARALRRAVDGIEVPTLLLWGDADQLVGRPVIEHLATRRPDWELHVFETVGHVPQLEVPHAYVEVVGRFLADDDRDDLVV